MFRRRCDKDKLMLAICVEWGGAGGVCTVMSFPSGNNFYCTVHCSITCLMSNHCNKFKFFLLLLCPHHK
jgi:hypothetical protein